MKIIDISKGLMTSPVYPGDPQPAMRKVSSINDGAECNVSAVFTCVHTGTHIDAPSHYLPRGASIEKLKLDNYIGECSVVTTSGIITGAEMEEIVEASKPRILLRTKGIARISESAAYILKVSDVKLIGIDSLSLAPDGEEATIHKFLLGAGIGILENLDLISVYDGDYFLCAQPLLIEGSDGAPTRAVLLKFDE